MSFCEILVLEFLCCKDGQLLYCSRKEEAGNCYQNVLSAFGSDCYTQEMTIMKAMVLGGQNQGYDVKDCIGI